MKTSTKNTIINGVFGIFGMVIGAVIGNNLPNNNYNVTIENSTEFISLQEEYKELESKYDSAVQEKADLQNKIDQLNTELVQISSVEEENSSLKEEIENLNSEISTLKNTSNNTESNEVTNNPSDRTSIFDLDTFKGNAYWSDHSSYKSSSFIDTYGNDYLEAYVGNHQATSKDSSRVITYLLDNKYSTCEGKIAWPKNDKNSKESAWLEFYSGDELIYKTDPITADSLPLPFSFSVKDIEKLTIIRNGTGNQYNSVQIIYPYFDLVK